jgi:preprotein translocase subunit SecA
MKNIEVVQKQLALAITDLIEIIEIKDASHPDLISTEPTPELEKIKREGKKRIDKLKAELKEISK